MAERGRALAFALQRYSAGVVALAGKRQTDDVYSWARGLTKRPVSPRASCH
jgi:hypothetical protein